MQVKLKKYNKWYNSKKNHIADISILNVMINKDLSNLYKIFDEVIKKENVLLNFSSRHEFDNETIISENIETLTNYISNNNGNLEAGGRSAYKNMVSHYSNHVLNEGHTYLGKNIILFTNNTKSFYGVNQII